MNIYIEAYSITHPYVGIGEFCLNLGQQLAQRATELKEKYDINLTFIVPKGYEGTFGNDVGYVSFLGDMKFLSRLHGSCIDLLHLPHQYCRFKHFPNVKNTLMTIHDINFMYEKQGDKLERYKKKFTKKLKASNYISYISQFTKKDVEDNFKVECGTRIIYNGVSKIPAESVTVTEEFKKRLPQKPYLFHISSLRPKKNVHLLIEMMAYLPHEHLVIAGDWSGKYGEDMQERIKELELQNITCLNNVSIDEKIWLYNNSKAFLFPSVCEGFGLPPIEAMYYGKPAFLSELTSLPEVGGEHAFYWHELEPKKMAALVEDKLKIVEAHPEMASEIHHSTDRFDWKKCVDEYIQYYLDIIQSDNQKKRSIIQIVSNKEWGGGEQYVKDLSLKLQEDGEDVTIACNRKSAIAKLWAATGLTVKDISINGFVNLATWRGLWNLSQIVKHGRYIIHAHNFRDGLLVSIAIAMSGNEKNAHLIITRHLVKKSRTNWSYKWLYKKVDKILFVSNIAKITFLKNRPLINENKLIVLHNSIQPKLTEKVDIYKEFGIEPDVPIIMFHGRICPEKGLDVLIDAVSLMHNSHFYLLLVGESKPYFKERLKNKIDSLGLKDKVIFAGFRQHVISYISQCTFGVCPSVVCESFQLSSLEYMSQGKCVITSSNGGQAEFIESNVNGILVPPGDTHRLAESMDMLLDCQDLCMQYGRKAQQDFENSHNYSSFYHAIKKIYDEVTS